MIFYQVFNKVLKGEVQMKINAEMIEKHRELINDLIFSELTPDYFYDESTGYYCYDYCQRLGEKIIYYVLFISINLPFTYYFDEEDNQWILEQPVNRGSIEFFESEAPPLFSQNDFVIIMELFSFDIDKSGDIAVEYIGR